MGKRVALFLALTTVTAFAGPADVPVLFSNRTDTVVGQDLFVLGSIPQLGSWVRNQSIKMVPSNCSGSTCDWIVTLALPAGASYEYKFVKRYDCACCWDSPNISCYGRTDDVSIVYEPGANRTGSTPALPAAPYTGKTLFYYSTWPNVSLYYSNNVTGWTNQPMIAIGPGRGGSEQLWRADGVDTAGSTNVQFGFFTVNAGTNVFDNAGRPGADYQTPLDACVVQDGQVYNYWPPPFVSTNRVEVFFQSSTNGVLGRTIFVYLPRGYNENTNGVPKRYPVLYMNDGQNLFLGAGPFGGWNVDTNANDLIRFGKMRETIIVGMSNTTDRTCEYNPCNLTGCSPGLIDKYAAFIIQELKPHIDSTYRTLTDAENTGIAGSSRGGLCAAYLGWQYSDTFHRVGGLSPSFWGCTSFRDTLINPPKRPLRIYIDSGTVGEFPTTNPVCTNCYDGLAYTMTARDDLINNGFVFNVDLDHTIGYGQDHNEYWWCRRLPRCLTFLFPTSDEPNTVLDTAAPPRITAFAVTGFSNAVTWTSYRLRTYSLEGSTDALFSTSMTWSNLSTFVPEPLPWNYPTATATNAFRYFRVRELAVPSWPN